MSCIRKVSLIVNCGFARVCIYQNSNPTRSGRHAEQSINIPKRLANFKLQFGTHTNFGIPDGYFDARGKENMSQFDRDCIKILHSFKSKFRDDIGYSRASYLDVLSLVKWSELPNLEKNRHTLSKCTRCFELYKEHQSFFPLKPTYQPEQVVMVNKDALQRQGIKKFTTNALSELNRACTNEAGTSFTDALLQTKSASLERKKTSNEKRKEKRNIQRDITKKVNEQFAQTAAITLLTEGESKRKYHRKRIAQSFCSPEDQPKPKRKKHSPNFENITWDTEKLRETLQNWPTCKPVNWSAVAREHNIHGGNAGQVAKEYVK